MQTLTRLRQIAFYIPTTTSRFLFASGSAYKLFIVSVGKLAGASVVVVRGRSFQFFLMDPARMPLPTASMGVPSQFPVITW